MQAGASSVAANCCKFRVRQTRLPADGVNSFIYRADTIDKTGNIDTTRTCPHFRQMAVRLRLFLPGVCIAMMFAGAGARAEQSWLSPPQRSLGTPEMLPPLNDSLKSPSIEHFDLSPPPNAVPPVAANCVRTSHSAYGQAGYFETAVPKFGKVFTPTQPTYFVRGVARAYYLNDQRLEFTGQEATFGAEAAVRGAIWRESNGWLVQADAELFFNQPFDRNILVDSPSRASFAHNFDIEPVEISQLYLSAKRGDFSFSVGKFVTPFGRAWFPSYQNDRNDAPFIRSEAILWRETGLLLQYQPGPWRIAAAAVNGGLNRDTNSSKALLARLGFQLERCAGGISIKHQDGIGSEGQKTINNHIGADLMVNFGRWRFSAEVIRDQYGLRRPLDPNSITWGRSYYFREVNIGRHVAINGTGWYLNVNYDGPKWFLAFNYGEYYPQQIGNRGHDQVNHRAIAKAIYHHSDVWDIYLTGMIEDSLELVFAGRDRVGRSLTTGFQMRF